MKYMISWCERPQGSPIEYENAQKRILGIFRRWAVPESFNVQQFVVRVGDYGGYMLVETADAGAIHKLTSTFPAFQFRVEPVLEVMDAVAVELEAIAWRDCMSAGFRRRLGHGGGRMRRPRQRRTPITAP